MVNVPTHHPEELPAAPKSSGLLGYIKSFAASVGNLFAEDPMVQAVLTPEFIAEFKGEYDRMLNERREGLDTASIAESFRVNGMGYSYDLFGTLMKLYQSDFRGLSDIQMRRVSGTLLEECGLIPGL